MKTLIGIIALVDFIGLLAAAGGIESGAPGAVLWAALGLLVLAGCAYYANRRA